MSNWDEIKRFFSASPSESSHKPDLRLSGAPGYELEVVGESHHIRELTKLVGEHGVRLQKVDEFDLYDVRVRLIPEPTNPADPNAIMVASSRRECLGYLARGNAKRYAPVLFELARENDLWCNARIGGGNYEETWRIGVWLNLDSASDLRKAYGLGPAPKPKPQPTQSPIDQLRELSELRDQGVLTAEEFDAKKTALLERI